MAEKNPRVLPTLITLTLMFIFAQITFVFLQHYLDGMFAISAQAIINNAGLLLPPLIQFMIAQIIIYSFFIYVLWMITISIGELFSIRSQYIKTIGIAVWMLSMVTLMSANTYFVPHSFFTSLVYHHLFSDTLTNEQVTVVLIITTSIFSLLLSMTVINIIMNMSRNKHQLRNSIAIVSALLVSLPFAIAAFTKTPVIVVTTNQPNIFIIGFDAIRPDYLSYFNNKGVATPGFNSFLNSSIVFTDSYAPLARTFPSWTSILTSKYPIHNKAREDNIDVNVVNLHDTLAKTLRKAGYETIFASDDTRFGNINSEFGFDRIIGDNGNVVDFLMSTINDYPFSNLLIPTSIGKILFPFNYGNHGSAFTYNADNFLDLINSNLRQRSNKPLFMAVHFNVTAFPFFQFNDKQPYNAGTLNLYKQSIQEGDRTLSKFLANLQAQGLLSNAIVILISDHGMALGLPKDRVTSKELFQGNKNDIRLKRYKYFNDSNNYTSLDHSQAETTYSLDPKNYGIDTAYGYGTDLLSLTQNKHLLAFRVYGKEADKPHQVSGRSTTLDIAPTIVDLLGLPALSDAEGISLKPYLLSATMQLPERAIYLESAFSKPEIEADGILVANVVTQNVGIFEINPASGFVFITPKALDFLAAKKQRAILQGDWLLAYYPSAIRYQPIRVKNSSQVSFQPYLALPYAVLVNLKTGQWTTDMNNPFVSTAPLKQLTNQLQEFYGKEMKSYDIGSHVKT